MEIELLAFGITKDILDQRKQSITIKEGTTIQELRKDLNEKYPELSKLKSLSIACNEAYVDDNYIIESNSTIALIPPVSGG